MHATHGDSLLLGQQYRRRSRGLDFMRKSHRPKHREKSLLASEEAAQTTNKDGTDQNGICLREINRTELC
jgi:hypothetical protein